jgi:DNA gyrase subunit B
MNDNLLEIYKAPAHLIFKDKEKQVISPTDLFSTILSEGEKGLTLQRYKGLGEMNPDQLWETTLDPNARTLLKVKIDRFSDAHEIFDKLMGDVVEPRRLFIQENALTVTNLDF